MTVLSSIGSDARHSPAPHQTRSGRGGASVQSRDRQGAVPRVPAATVERRFRSPLSELVAETQRHDRVVSKRGQRVVQLDLLRLNVGLDGRIGPDVLAEISLAVARAAGEIERYLWRSLKNNPEVEGDAEMPLTPGQQISESKHQRRSHLPVETNRACSGHRIRLAAEVRLATQ